MAELTPKQRAALELLEQGEEYQTYFFRTARGLIWFHPLRQRGYFDARRNPSPTESTDPGFYTIPHWPVLDYLERVATECGRRDDSQLADELLQILRDVTQPGSGAAPDNYRTWWYFVKIMRQLPTRAVRLADVEMIDRWLESRFSTSLLGEELGQHLLPKFLDSADPDDCHKASRIIEIATTIRWVPRRGIGPDQREAVTRIEPHWLRALFTRNSAAIANHCGEGGVALLAQRLREAVLNSGDEYSYIWRPAIEDHRHNHERESARDLLISALRDVAFSFVSARGAASAPTIAALLADDSRTVRRVALHLIDVEYEALQNLFWERIDRAFFALPYRHEVFLLLHHHFHGFTPSEQSRLLELIEGLAGDWVTGVDAETMNAALRLEWLDAIRGQGSDQADALYRGMQAIAKFSPEHPEFPSYSETSVGWGESPVSSEDLLSRPLDEVAATLRGFRERREWNAPTAGGLAEALKQAVVARPEKFEVGLDAFRDIQPAYLTAIFDGFEALWKAKKRIAWDRVLDLALALLRDPTFWTREPDVGDTNWIATTTESVVSTIVGLVEAGLREDEWAFDPVHLPQAAEVIDLALAHVAPSATGATDDALTEAYNTVRGQSLRALINYALRKARLLGRPTPDQRRTLWTELAPWFERELARCQNANLEFSALAGSHLPNLYYLNAAWVEQNIDRIFPEAYERNWRAAIEGFSFINRFDRRLFLLLRDHGHLAKALALSFRNQHVREQLVRHIAIAYLLRLEDLEGAGLFANVLRDWRADNICEIIWLFWQHHEDGADAEILARILGVWEWCISRIESRESENQAILSDLNILAVLLDSIDATRLRWLMISAPYADVKYRSSFLVEYLARLASSSPEAVAKIVLRMLTKVTPTYDAEYIRSIVRLLYDGSLVEDADAICNHYAKAGHVDLLRDLYESHHR